MAEFEPIVGIIGSFLEDAFVPSATFHYFIVDIITIELNMLLNIWSILFIQGVIAMYIKKLHCAKLKAEKPSFHESSFTLFLL